MGKGAQAESKRLVTGPIFATSLRFGLPLALGMAAHGLFNCVDLLIVGRLGEGAVAAVTLGGVINMVAMLAFNGIANVLGGRAAHLAGAGDEAGLDQLERRSERMTLVASLVLGASLALLARPLIELAGADPRTADLGTSYLVISALGSGTMFFVLWGTAIFRARGESFWPMVVLIGSNALNLALDLLLVFGFWGFPRLGVAGAAWATVIARAVGALLLVAVLHRRRAGRGPRPLGRDGLMRGILSRGLINSAQTIARVLGLYGLLSLAARSAAATGGPLAARDLLDGVGVAIRLEMVLMFAALGFGAAATSFVAQNLGAGRADRARKGLLALVIEACFFGSLLAAFLWWLRSPLFIWTAPGAAVDSQVFGQLYLSRLLPAQPVLVLGLVLSQALVGMGSVKTAAAVDFAIYLLLVPLVIFGLGAQPATGFLVLALAHALAALVYIPLTGRRLRRESALVSRSL